MQKCYLGVAIVHSEYGNKEIYKWRGTLINYLIIRTIQIWVSSNK
jgi:hypothetical protein